MPISRVIEEVALLTGIQLSTADRKPNVASTVVPASSTGIAAATSEPNTASRISRVRGSERVSDRLMSSLMLLSTAPDTLRSPACASRASGWRAATASTAAVAVARLARISVPVPRSRKVTRPDRPSAETWAGSSSGPRMSATAPEAANVVIKSVVTAGESRGTKTFSQNGSRDSWRSRAA